MASRQVARQNAERLLGRFWKRETHPGRLTPPGFPESSPNPTTTALEIPNPFIPIRNPTTGKWRPARYSGRRQAELVKAARLVQVEPLLPLGPRGQRNFGRIPPDSEPASPELSKRLTASSPAVQWQGTPPPLNEKGLYGGRRFMFKGHKWERQLPEREQNLYNFKTTHEEKRAATASRLAKLERKAERKRLASGILQ